jgi:hypothetical protein
MAMMNLGARFLLAFCMAMVYPLENFVAKHCLFSMYIRLKNKYYPRHTVADAHRMNDSSSSSMDDRPSPGLARSMTSVFASTMSLMGLEYLVYEKTSAESLHNGSDHVEISNHHHHGYKDIAMVDSSSWKEFKDDASVSSSSGRQSIEMINQEISEIIDHEHEFELDDELLTIHFNHGLTDYDLNNGPTTVQEAHPTPSLAEHVSITLLIWTLTVLIAIFSSDLSVVLALTGAVAASALGYVIPGLLYIQTFKADFDLAAATWSSNQEPQLAYERMRKFVMPIVMMVFGVLCMFIGCLTVFIDDV